MNDTFPHPIHRVLVIDDNQAIHDDFRKILAKPAAVENELAEMESSLFGDAAPACEPVIYEVDSALQGKEGLEKVRQALAEGRPYVLAFVDVRMPPGWDGIDTTARLWQEDPDLQVVISTAYSDYSWSELNRHLGKAENLLILKKPFDNVEVLQLARALTLKWTLTRQVRGSMRELDRKVDERTRELQETNAKLEEEITQRKQIEEALRISEQRFARAFMASPIPFAIRSFRDDRYVDVNESFAQMLGYQRQELVMRNAGELQLHADPAQHAHIRRQLLSQKQVRNQSFQWRSKTGAIRQTLFSAELFELAVEHYVLIIANDITDQISLENQLRQAQKMEAVGQLAAGVAHDFNNLLTVIQGHTSLSLALPGLGEPLQESLHEIAKAGDRASSLTRQLLAFSRRQIIQRRLVKVNNVLFDLGKMLGRLIGEHIQLEWRLGEDLLPVFADVGCLEQVMINLAVNARDAMAKGGRLTVATFARSVDEKMAKAKVGLAPGKYVCISVADTGHGMSPAVMSRIFEPFYTTKEVGHGTGLGLATVYGILKQHNGYIEVASAEGKGATFTCYLPVDCHAPQHNSTEGPVRTAGHASVLLVEDDASIRTQAARALRAHGYAVREAGTGSEALKVWELHDGKFDLLLTDVVMPEGMSGRVLAETLLAGQPGLRVVFMSGYNLDFIAGRKADKKSDFFLQKPFEIATMIDTVERCLGSKAQGTPAPRPQVAAPDHASQAV